MGFYFRKSIGFGPFRINLSKSGIGASVGVKGVRVGAGPRGARLTVSSHGLFYRQKIGSSAGNSQAQNSMEQAGPSFIETQAIRDLSDGSTRVSLVTLFGFIPLVIFIVGMFAFSYKSKTVIIRPERDSITVKIRNGKGLNMRKAPFVRSGILKVAGQGEVFILLDSTNSKWLKVQDGDQTGYISKKLTVIDHVHLKMESQIETVLVNPGIVHQLGAGVLAFIILMAWLKIKERKRVELKSGK